MKRRTNNTTIDGDRDYDFGSRPVETTEKAAVNKETQVKIPRAQAFWVALSFSVAIIVTIVSPIALGSRIFWAVCGVVALAAFIWSIAYEATWLDRLSLPVLCGVVAWCFWRFADWQGWRVPDRWQPIPALLSLSSVVFWWAFTAALWVTFWQRLGMPLYHQQYSVWRALGALIEHWGKKERVAPQVVDPEPVRFEFVSENGRVRHNVETPFDKATMQWIARVLQEETLSEASLCGPDKPLPGGQNGRAQLAELREWLIEYGLARWNRTNGNDEPVVTQGVSLTRNGARWVDEVGR